MDIEALAGKVASMTKVEVDSMVQEESVRLSQLAPKMASFRADVIVKPLTVLLAASVTALPVVVSSVFVMIGEVALCGGIEMVPADVAIDWALPDPRSIWPACKVIPAFMPAVVPLPGNT